MKEAPSPKCVQELKAYLGLLTYYSEFLPNMSTVLAPLYRLLRKDVSWQWIQVEEKAFDELKSLLTVTSLLVHFYSSLPHTLACDASAYGVGAVLAHKTHWVCITISDKRGTKLFTVGESGVSVHIWH